MCTSLLLFSRNLLSHLRYKIKKFLGFFRFICSNINVVKIPGRALKIRTYKSYYLENVDTCYISSKFFLFIYLPSHFVPTALYIHMKNLILSPLSWFQFWEGNCLCARRSFKMSLILIYRSHIFWKNIFSEQFKYASVVFKTRLLLYRLYQYVVLC
jgi:hypothetical protein